MRRLAAIALAASLATGCSGGGDDPPPTSAAPPTTTPAPTTTSLALSAGQVLHPQGAQFQYGATMVTIGDLVYDPERASALVGVRLQNLAGVWVFPELATALQLDGTELFGTYRSVELPPGISFDTTIEFAGLPGDPSEGGQLLWGRPDRARPVVDLSSGALVDGGGPSDVAVEGWASIGRHAVHVTGAQLMPGSLGLNQQVQPGESVLRVGFDAFSAVQDPVNGFYPPEHLTLRRSDGSVVEAIASSDGYAPVSWTTVSGQWAEFVVSESALASELLVSSISPKALGTLFPDKIERVALPLDIDMESASTWQRASALGVAPVPSLDIWNGASEPAAPFTQPLDVEGINVPGFWVDPTELSYDPSTATAELDVDVTSLVVPAQEIDTSTAAGQAAGLLDVDPIFSFTVALSSSGLLSSGSIIGDASVPAGETRSFTVSFGAVTALSADDAAVLIGARSSQASSIPLGPDSTVPRYPARPSQRAITADPATADHWTVQLVSYRLGLFSPDQPPPAGMRELEVMLDVTAATDAPVKALGLGFRGSVQLFMESPDGYLIQPVADNRYVTFEPGATHRLPVTFRVSERFEPGSYRFVLRGADETADVTTNVWTETSFVADLGTNPAPAVAAVEGVQ